MSSDIQVSEKSNAGAREVAIQVENVSKRYCLYDKPSARLWQMLWRGKRNFYRVLDAVHDVSFTVYAGEVLGIVGHNGSGKSTLLQMICGTLTPSAGSVRVQGRISALLELGSGFNPEFTGRENIYLNASLLGLSREETNARLDEIIDFSGIPEFIDRPVKTYSSGMVVRLAFAVATAVDPDILVVDEALAVGDESFQGKCFARIRRLRERGCTILFVSHAAGTVVDICDRALLMDAGDMLMEGAPKAVVTQYHKLVFAAREDRPAVRAAIKAQEYLGGYADDVLAKNAAPATVHAQADDITRINTELGDEEYYLPELLPESTVSYAQVGAEIISPFMTTLSGNRVNVLKSGKRYQYHYQVRFDTEAHDVRFGMMIKTRRGVELGGATTAEEGEGISSVRAGEVRDVSFEFECLLGVDTYFMNCGCSALVNGERVFLHRIVDAYIFKVIAGDARNMRGMIDFKISLQTTEESI